MKLAIPDGVKKYLSQVMKDVDGKFSSKRSVVAVAVLVFVVISMANLFGGFKFEQSTLDTCKYIIMTGLGLSGAEKFTGRQQAT